jgi:hypothetical protein
MLYQEMLKQNPKARSNHQSVISTNQPVLYSKIKDPRNF